MIRNALVLATVLATTACAPDGSFEPDLSRKDAQPGNLGEHIEGALMDHGARLVVTEVMRNPAAADDGEGEWIEVFNQSSEELNLRGLEVRDSSGQSFVIDYRVRLPAYGYAVFAGSSDPAVNGGIEIVDFAWGDSFSLANDGDDIELVFEGVVDDTVVFDTLAAEGVSEQLSNSWLAPDANDDASHWCSGADAYGAGDRGTPGSRNLDCGDTVIDVWDLWGGELVITEIMRNPDAVSDARGEWFELHNTTDALIDLEGVAILDSAGHGFELPEGLTIEPHGYLVLGQNSDFTINGGVSVDYQWPGSLTLGNGADDLIIDALGYEIDRVAWESSWDAPVGASLILRDTVDPMLDNDEASNWCVATDAYGAGDKGTPGQPGGC